MATKMQLRLQITQLLLGDVVISPMVCPKYRKATHDPHISAPLAVSQSIPPLSAAWMDPGSSERAASENRATAYKLASTPGCANTTLAQVKLLA